MHYSHRFLAGAIETFPSPLIALIVSCSWRTLSSSHISISHTRPYLYLPLWHEGLVFALSSRPSPSRGRRECLRAQVISLPFTHRRSRSPISAGKGPYCGVVHQVGLTDSLPRGKECKLLLSIIGTSREKGRGEEAGRGLKMKSENDTHGFPYERKWGKYRLFQILGSEHEFHFVHDGLPHARSKRSVRHIRKLKSDHRVRSTLYASASPPRSTSVQFTASRKLVHH